EDEGDHAAIIHQAGRMFNADKMDGISRRHTRFSRASWRGPPKRKGTSRSSWSRSVIIAPTFSPDQRRGLNHRAGAAVWERDTGRVGRTGIPGRRRPRPLLDLLGVPIPPEKTATSLLFGSAACAALRSRRALAGPPDRELGYRVAPVAVGGVEVAD